MTGTNVSHYEVLGKLGEGGMGVVYKARDVKLNRFVALKFLPARFSANEDMKRRFIREAEAASALDHTHICTIYEIDETEEGHLFIAMGFYGGDTLKQKIEQGPLSVKEAVAVATQVALGLERAHEAGIVHRDIKPANVIVTDRGVVKILDFGLAKLSGSVDLTKTGSTLGTAAYMSPEQARGEVVDERTDIWALGVMLYEMLAGERPFQGDYAQAIIYALLNVDPVPLASLREDVPQALVQLVEKALAKQADERYARIDELLTDLQALRSSGQGRLTSVSETPAALAPTLFKAERHTADLQDAKALLDDLQPPTPEEKPVPSIAVLPFTNLSPDPDQEYFSDGLTEEVITDLSPVRALRVISRTSSMMLKGTRKDVRTIGRELDVQYVLEGSVRKAGNQLRITAQLIDAVNDAQLWAEKYRGTLDDVFEIQEQVSRAIVKALRVRLSSDEDAAIAEHSIPNLLAYDYYLRARHDIYASNAKALERALANLERGLELTGKNSVMLRGMGLVMFQLVNMGIDTNEKLIEELLEIASDLDEIDPTSAHGPLLKAFAAELQGDTREAVRHFRIAYARDSNDHDAIFWLCIASCSTGQVALARCLADKLVSIDPLVPLVHFFVGYTAFFDGKAGEGLDAVRRALEIGGKDIPALLWGSVRIMAASGYMEEARQLTTMLDERHTDSPFSSMTRGFILALDGSASEARSAITPEIEAWTGSMAEWAQFIGDFFAVLGDKDRALEWLERSVSLGFLNVPFLAQGDPFLRTLRGDPRFQDLVAQAERELREFEETLLPVKCQ